MLLSYVACCGLILGSSLHLRPDLHVTARTTTIAAVNTRETRPPDFTSDVASLFSRLVSPETRQLADETWERVAARWMQELDVGAE